MAIALVLFGLLRSTRVPVYQGKDYYAWAARLQAAQTNYSDTDRSKNIEASSAAIRAMGSDALKLALADVHARLTLRDRIVLWARPRLPSLKLKAPDPQARWVRGIRALEALSPLPKTCLAELIFETTNNIGFGGGALMAVGPDAIPSFTNILSRSSFPLTGNLISYFANTVYGGRITIEQAAVAVPSLLKVFQGRDWHGRWYAASALGAIHTNPEECLPILITGVADSNPTVRAECINAVGQYGAAASPYARNLAEQYDQGSGNTRRAICTAFGNFHEAARVVVPVLVKGLADADQTVRVASANSLGQLAALPEQSIPALITATKDSSQIVRLMSVQSVELFQSRATNAIPALEEACLDTDRSVRDIATNALKRVTQSDR